MRDANLTSVLLRRLDQLEKRVRQLETQEREASSLILKDGITAPATVSGLAIIYVDTSDGDLKVKFGDGFVGTIVADS